MKKLFPGYYSPSDEDFKKMWDEGIFVLDTNVLLDLYRYSDETVKELFKVIELIKDRIWIPYQVIKEYHKNLNTVISGQVKKYTASIDTLKQFKSQIDEKRNHPFLNNALQNEIEAFCGKINSELEEKRKGITNLILKNPIKDQLADILNNRIGNCFKEEELDAICKEGENRYLYSIPPGYKDKSKPEPDRYGDLIFWKEILKKNAEIDNPIILVTGDTKEDWYYQELGMTIGPRPELIDEFYRTKHNLFYIYPTNAFLTFAVSYLKTSIDSKSIEEVDGYIKQGRTIELSQSVSTVNITENTIFTIDKGTTTNTECSTIVPEITNAP